MLKFSKTKDFILMLRFLQVVNKKIFQSRNIMRSLMNNTQFYLRNQIQTQKKTILVRNFVSYEKINESPEKNAKETDTSADKIEISQFLSYYETQMRLTNDKSKLADLRNDVLCNLTVYFSSKETLKDEKDIRIAKIILQKSIEDVSELKGTMQFLVYVAVSSSIEKIKFEPSKAELDILISNMPDNFNNQNDARLFAILLQSFSIIFKDCKEAKISTKISKLGFSFLQQYPEDVNTTDYVNLLMGCFHSNFHDQKFLDQLFELTKSKISKNDLKAILGSMNFLARMKFKSKNAAEFFHKIMMQNKANLRNLDIL